MTLLVFLGLVLPIMLFGLRIYFFRLSNRNLKLLVAFSGAFLLSLSFNKFIPHIYAGLADSKEVVATCSGTQVDHGHDHHNHAPGEPCIDTEETITVAEQHAHAHGHHHAHGPAKIIGLFILLGFFIQLILDYLMQ